MRVSNKRVIVWLIIFGTVIWFFYLSGYRPTALGAAQAALGTYGVAKQARLWGRVDFHHSQVFLFDTPEGPRTVLSTGKWFLWRAPDMTRLEPGSNVIRTVGWMSFAEDSGQGTVLAVETSDPHISFVEAGSPGDRIKKDITPDKPVIFSWAEEIPWSDLKPVAFSGDDKPLWVYRPDQGPVYTGLKWYPVNSKREAVEPATSR